MFQPQTVDWDGDKYRNFGCPSFITNDVNSMSDRGLLTQDTNGCKFLVVGLAIEIPQYSFEVFELLGVSAVSVDFFIFMMDLSIVKFLNFIVNF